MSGGSSENREVGFCEVAYMYQELDGPIAPEQDEKPESPWSYAVKLGKKPIVLSGIEWRILKFLSSKPYHAFTPRRIAEAVTTETQPVTEDALRGHIASLREKLGFFADYVQTVPYIGYRFKE